MEHRAQLITLLWYLQTLKLLVFQVGDRSYRQIGHRPSDAIAQMCRLLGMHIRGPYPAQAVLAGQSSTELGYSVRRALV